MAQHTEVPGEILARLRSVCLGLPEAYEEPAWVGTRWRIRTHTFAHVLTIDNAWPPTYVKASGLEGPATILTFESSGQDLDAFGHLGHPFSRPQWRPTVVGVVLESGTDWIEVAELITDSYCQLAPKKLARTVARPTPS